ncbi:MAG: PqqD family protein [Anaerolineales bacterium]|nr:PqqD family protein [Anaerolineales bacterium]
MKGSAIPAPIAGFQLEALDGEIVLLHPTRNLVVHGNSTCALIWQLCDGIRSVDEIVEILTAAYPEASAEIRSDVTTTIQTMLEQGVLQTM